ncbi:TetR/AcrR family transcriptional regulator [Nocardia sp. NEAU-G5]|uniref:TetR/AcrR family transcriptional regulator n=1 Tax=Nocardia albiluteola TaxID=2842303 RepID=A0ABS6AQX7_9NOCA|nr:TetR/AcrR family transcriptional regulator [Nocardia albiluteola]MBU3060426.1 TetR/AcrR family transcriptional regulator [Nocardia albiluteola]
MPPAPNPQLRSQRSHQAILDATFALAVEKGYARMSIDAIAAAAGVGKQTIYRWWPSKGAVALDAVNEKMGTATDFPDTGDIAADLKTQITALSELLAGDIGGVYQAVIAEAQSDPHIAAAVRETIVEPRLEQCCKRLDSAITAGELRGDIPTRAMVEMLYGPVYYRFLLHAPESDLRLGADHVDHLLTGLRPHS